MNSKAHKIPVSLKNYSSIYSTEVFQRYGDKAVNCLLFIFPPFSYKKGAAFPEKKKTDL